MVIEMLMLRLPVELEKRLDEIAKKTQRTKSFLAREAMNRTGFVGDFFI